MSTAMSAGVHLHITGFCALSLLFPASTSALGLFLTEAPVGILVKDHPQLHYCPQDKLAELALFQVAGNGQVNDGMGLEEGVCGNGAAP